MYLKMQELRYGKVASQLYVIVRVYYPNPDLKTTLIFETLLKSVIGLLLLKIFRLHPVGQLLECLHPYYNCVLAKEILKIIINWIMKNRETFSRFKD